MQPSPQQEACVSAAKEPSNLIVESCAGSGKTTTGVMMAKALPQSTHITACAFNTRIADTLREVMPQNTLSKTFNSLGHQSWGRRAKFGKPDTRKSWRIADQLKIKDCPDFARAISLLKSAGYAPPNALGLSVRLVKDIEDCEEMFDDHDLDFGEVFDPYEALAEAMTLSIALAWKGDIDFDDQIYMPALCHGNFPETDVIIVDEAQDVSMIQRQMIRVMAGKKARVLALGDRHQAIYGFRGADYTSMDAFQHDFGCKPLHLSISYRCPQLVVEEARRYVQHIEPHPDAPKGLVQHLEKFGPFDFKPGDAILCRNNAPLVKLCYSMIRAGVGCTILGRDIGAGLVKLIKRSKAPNVQYLEAWLLDNGISEVTMLRQAGKTGKAGNLQDKIESLLAVCGGLAKQTSVMALCTKIEAMFEGNHPILLSTIHKAKGLEWERVFFLDKYLIPSPYANSKSQLQQEHNLAYVGVTRAKHTLNFISSLDYHG